MNIYITENGKYSDIYVALRTKLKMIIYAPKSYSAI